MELQGNKKLAYKLSFLIIFITLGSNIFVVSFLNSFYFTYIK